MKKETGGPAFPQVSYNMKGGYDITGGMSLRDYLAAKALDISMHHLKDYYGINKQNVAEWCYEMADAMLKEREK